MPDILLIANPVVLAALFIYQHYRLKFLATSMAEQRQLITETKAVVTQQATAITSQATVVDTAIKYSQSFDLSKVENLIRRELSLEFADEKARLEKELSSHKAKTTEVATASISSAMEQAADYVKRLFSPVVSRYVLYLLSLPPAERDLAISTIEEKDARELIEGIIDAAKEKFGNIFPPPNSALRSPPSSQV
jgi:uncharacterized coiled-coil protein SlyX